MAVLDQGLKVSVYLSGEGAVVVWLKSVIHFWGRWRFSLKEEHAFHDPNTVYPTIVAFCASNEA
ncbi:MAG: hypothetical protein ABSC13_00870 [Dehalococcoidia bacterium]